MEILQDPTVTYLLLATGLIVAVLALAAPGTGFLELGALALIMAAGAAILVYDLAINAWALLVLLVGAVLFAVSIRTRRLAVLSASIVAIVIGSAYLFQGDEWWIPGVNIYVALVVSVLSGGFFWLGGHRRHRRGQDRYSAGRLCPGCRRVVERPQRGADPRRQSRAGVGSGRFYAQSGGSRAATRSG
jgi:hypothetical protein